MFLSHDLTTPVGTLSLLPLVVRAVTVPVVAAGGSADATGCRENESARAPRPISPLDLLRAEIEQQDQ